jgi:DNA-binding protein HU-beta
MRKKELVAKIAETAGLKEKDAAAALQAFVDVVGDELKKGESVQIIGFGTFDVSERAARTGRNPANGEEIQIKASKAPRFKAGKALKDKIN